MFSKTLIIACSIAVVLGDSSSSPAAAAEAALRTHNLLRAKHGVPPLKLSPELTAYAQDWANNMAKIQNLQHHPHLKYGESLHSYCGGEKHPGREATLSWYEEINNYDFNKPGFSVDSGHFTQLVWRDTKELGFGIAKASNGWTYVVANYNPPGNHLDKFPENVLKPKINV